MKKLLVILFIACYSLLHSADSLKVVWGMKDHFGAEFTDEQLEYVDFKAWIGNYGENYTSNITNVSDPGNSVKKLSYRAVCEIDFNNFEGWEWRDGDVFFLEITDHCMDFSGSYWYSTSVSWLIPENSLDTNIFGMEPLTSYGGDPISSWTVYSLIDDVYIGTVDHDGNAFDFSGEPYDNVTFECWITGREDDIEDQNSIYSEYIYNEYSNMSAIKILRYGFSTNWASGDTLNVKITQHFPGSGYYTGESKFVFSNIVCFSHYGPFQIDFGLDYVYGDGLGGGDPVTANIWTADTGIENTLLLPEETELFQNYPNPFNPVTQIKYDLAKTSTVKLRVYNISGQLVSELVNDVIPAGYHIVDFDGSSLNSGVYFYTLESKGVIHKKKMLLIK